jgi:hypothetical protein
VVRRRRRLVFVAAIVALVVWRQRMLAGNERHYGST